MSQQSVPRLLEETISANPEMVAYSYKQEGRWIEVTWKEFGAEVERLTRGLIAADIEPGARVGILSESRLEWVLCDFAILNAACVTVGLYAANLAPECAYVINHSDAELLFVENLDQLAKIREVRTELPNLRQIVLFEGPTDEAEGILSWNDFLERGDAVEKSLITERRMTIEPDDLAALVYTSGTTGLSKGVMLSHRNLCFTSESIGDSLTYKPGWITLLFLPLAHVYARAIVLMGLRGPVTIAFAENLTTVRENLLEIRPHFFASAPRAFEKFHDAMLSSAAAAGGLKKLLFDWAIVIGLRASRLRQDGEPVPELLRWRLLLADKLVYSKIKAALGGRLQFTISGAAPLNKAIAEFFDACGVLILEGIGMTENTSFSHVNRMESNKFGTVGLPGPGIEAKLAEDGEVLYRGDNVMQGYFKDPVATSQALDPDGWLHSGDIGEIDDQGFLRITDRKKDILVTAGGKNVAPQRIERIMRTSHYISQVMAYGDKRKFISLLVTLEPDAITEWAVQKGIGVAPVDELANHPRVKEMIRTELEERNKQLASYESIKKFHILPHEFTIEGGEITATMKIKRKVVTQKYKEQLDALYE